MKILLYGKKATLFATGEESFHMSALNTCIHFCEYGNGQIQVGFDRKNLKRVVSALFNGLHANRIDVYTEKGVDTAQNPYTFTVEGIRIERTEGMERKNVPIPEGVLPQGTNSIVNWSDEIAIELGIGTP